MQSYKRACGMAQADESPTELSVKLSTNGTDKSDYRRIQTDTKIPHLSVSSGLEVTFPQHNLPECDTITINLIEPLPRTHETLSGFHRKVLD